MRYGLQIFGLFIVFQIEFVALPVIILKVYIKLERILFKSTAITANTTVSGIVQETIFEVMP